jgi:hypothetical protein
MFEHMAKRNEQDRKRNLRNLQARQRRKAAREEAASGCKRFGRWNVRLVNEGDRYGRDDCLTHDKSEPMVEFYDRRYVDKFGPRGQFVSRYYLSTLTDDRGHLANGLCLDGGVPAWSVNAHDMAQVLAWLDEVAG